MASHDDYMKVATEIANHLNAFGLAFKTYQVTQFNEMLKTIAGNGARVSGPGDTYEKLKTALLERGFMIFPEIPDAEKRDGYVRVIRSNSIIGNLLNAFRYVGSNGDTELARLLSNIKRRSLSEDHSSDAD